MLDVESMILTVAAFPDGTSRALLVELMLCDCRRYQSMVFSPFLKYKFPRIMPPDGVIKGSEQDRTVAQSPNITQCARYC